VAVAVAVAVTRSLSSSGSLLRLGAQHLA